MSYYANRQEAVAAIIAVARRLDQKQLVTALTGNISCRLDNDYFLITPSGICKATLGSNDILLLDYDGDCCNHEPAAQHSPSSETRMHLALYHANTDIRAIVHAHPPYATALACSGRELNWQMLEEGRKLLGTLPLLPYLEAGSENLAQAVVQASLQAPALLLTGHGAVSWGETLELALARMEALEHTACVMLYQHLWQS